MRNKIKQYIPAIVVGLIFIIIILLLLLFYKDNDTFRLDINNVSFNNVVDDEEGMMLYNRYQVEDGLLFNFIGSNMYDGYYGYFYKDEVKNIPSSLKNIILIKNADYGSWDYDMDSRCYCSSLDNYKSFYNNLYGDEELDLTFDEKLNSKLIVDDNSICIIDTIDNNYTKAIDTYLVNIVRIDEKIIVYERVIFIEMKDDYLYFYKDYKQKELIYKLKVTSELDISFINNSEIVSNVLLEFQNELDIYEYTYVKVEDTYYLEGIKR